MRNEKITSSETTSKTTPIETSSESSNTFKFWAVFFITFIVCAGTTSFGLAVAELDGYVKDFIAVVVGIIAAIYDALLENANPTNKKDKAQTSGDPVHRPSTYTIFVGFLRDMITVAGLVSLTLLVVVSSSSLDIAKDTSKDTPKDTLTNLRKFGISLGCGIVFGFFKQALPFV